MQAKALMRRAMQVSVHKDAGKRHPGVGSLVVKLLPEHLHVNLRQQFNDQESNIYDLWNSATTSGQTIGSGLDWKIVIIPGDIINHSRLIRRH